MTNLEYLNQLLPPAFIQAVIRNVDKQNKSSRLIHAHINGSPIIKLFEWDSTEEGHGFWMGVYSATCLLDKKPCAELKPHPSWNAQNSLQKGATYLNGKLLPQLSGHNGLETPNQGQPQTNKNMLHKYADKPVATPTLVNGQDVTDLSDREILNQIKARKKSIEEIVATGATGAYVDHFRTQEGIAIEALLKELNSRAPQAAAPAAEA
jgi:hypothetical protein